MNKPMLLVWLDLRVPEFTATAERIESWRALVPELEIVYADCQEVFIRNLSKATYVFTYRFSEAWLPLTYRVKWLASPAAGQELLGCKIPDRIRLTHGTFHGKIIAESVLGMLLALRRGLLPGLGLASEATPWPEKIPGRKRIAGSRALILGYGHIGKIIGQTLERNGIEVAGITHSNLNTLESQLPNCDTLVLALPEAKDTDRILNAARLALMRSDAVVINIGRGNAIDEAALCDALTQRKLYAAFLDVASVEPYPSDGPLLHTPYCYVIPHSSAFAPDYLELAFEEWLSIYHADYARPNS